MLFAAIGAERHGRRLGVCFVAPQPVHAKASPAPAPAVIPDAARIVPSVCPSCGAAVRPNRRFCTACGASLSVPVPPQPAEVRPADLNGPILEQIGDCTRRRVDRDGQTAQLIQVPESGSMATFLAAAEASPAPSSVFAAPQQRESINGCLRLQMESSASTLAFAEWCRQHKNEMGFFDVLAARVAEWLAALGWLHDRGWSYGAPLADRLTLAGATARLDLPLRPLALGQPAPGASALLGYVCPEFGGEQPVASNWDLFALGAALFKGLGGREPPESLSNADYPLPPLRAWLSNLPVGWAGWADRLLARQPARRFPSAEAAADCLRRLTTAPSATTWTYRVAAGQHVGVGKIRLNPTNQDCCLFQTATTSHEDAPHTPFAGFAPEENFCTVDVADVTELVAAVSDGISTVSSGEFAARTIADSILVFARQVPANARLPVEIVADLFEHANAALGDAIRRAVEAGGTASRFTHPASSPSATLVAMLFRPEGAAVACVGDSRAYLLREGILEQLTVDGDQATVYLQRGLDIDRILQQEDAHELVSWIGRFATSPGPQGTIVQPDQPIEVTRQIGFWSLALPPRAGDVYCCCSDGISDYVDQGRIALDEILAPAHSPAEECRRLIDAANACGGDDNLSLVVVHVI